MQLPEDQYHKAEFPKNQIVLHHTASGPSAEGVINYWKSDKDRIATAFVIDGDGDIYQAFSSKYYAAHLGVSASAIKALGFADYGKRCDLLHKASIGIEICNWGGLTKDAKGRWVSYAGAVIKDCDIEFYPNGFRGYHAYQKYSPAILAATKELLLYLCDKYGISKEYKIGDFSVSKRAIGGENGIFTHTNYRPASDKQDLHPQPELIEMLKNLK
ncbi:MAG: hypothetical protein K0S09_7 [Sphingobacteriaceae bacterium]|nr:hypothetical protein [Sphingobacteriaceae bacterium]